MSPELTDRFRVLRQLGVRPHAGSHRRPQVLATLRRVHVQMSGEATARIFGSYTIGGPRAFCGVAVRSPHGFPDPIDADVLMPARWEYWWQLTALDSAERDGAGGAGSPDFTAVGTGYRYAGDGSRCPMAQLSPRDATFCASSTRPDRRTPRCPADRHPGRPSTARGSANRAASAKDASATKRPVLDYKHLVEPIENRLQLVPRYRQLVIPVTMGLARPCGPTIPTSTSISTSGVPGCPRRGSQQLDDLVARIMSRPLDRTRPLWEAYT